MPVWVRNGTPVGEKPLCDSCKNVHKQLGYRESEELVYCTFYGELRAVPFRVRECTDYTHKHQPDWEQMEKLAIPVDSTPSFKPAGFVLATEKKGQE
jgi:hypothetical protein